ncbi:elongation factor 2 [Coccidioides immitis H538.4]|uniref:Elongation factor 2 n=1 Tax=Coccidioides immitis H538.4 TaxID=396776 RepID=A0A0J8S6I4_COCIT|nr:elongation factor 2 [Coccidioides immitis H538.4]
MDDLYDEFGNYIGGAEESDEEEHHGEVPAQSYAYDLESEEEEEAAAPDQQLMEIDEQGPSNAVILHEDKQYYPTAQQVYGAEVETLVEEEDAQPLTQPIIAPIQQKKFAVQEADLPPVFYSREFMTDMLNFPGQIRNIALVGHIHHGKTAFMDTLVMETHDLAAKLDRRTGKAKDEQLRYTDVHLLERERGLSIKSAPMSLVLQGTKGKSYLFNVLDTPGHVNFVDEVAASLRLVDGVVLVVDVVEGVQINTEQIIKYAVIEDLPLTLVVNKMDRLILELKLHPTDAYFKLKHVIEEVNTVIEKTLPGQGEKRRLSPEKGNVAFACTAMNWCFTLQSFAKIESPEDLKDTLATLGISLKPSQLKSDARVLLKLVCEQFFGPVGGFVDMIVDHIPSPVEGAPKLLEKYYTGPLDTKIAAGMLSCDQDGQLVVHITKLFNTPDAAGFYAFGRIMSGTARPGQQVRVLGQGYTVDDEEDMVVATIADTFIAESRYNISTSGVPAGNWVLLSGIDNSIVKTATLVPLRLEDDEDAYIFKPVRHMTESVFKVAVEPINPSELPKMLEGLRKINKSYPLISTKVEESGEHIVLGTGELYMDCVLHDLRRLYAEMELKVSDPI